MKVEIFSNNLLQVNTYFLFNDTSCLIIDPGSNTKEVLKLIDKNHWNVIGIILTHAHFDHFIACNELNLLLDVPLYVHPKAIDLLYDSTQNVSSLAPIEPLVLDQSIQVVKINEETKNIGDFVFDLYHTPGHSPDGICLSFKEDKMVFTGDSLFKHSIGRCDFYYGNEKQLIKNIKNKLYKLADETIVYPGHGDSSTIGHEKKANPYTK